MRPENQKLTTINKIRGVVNIILA